MDVIRSITGISWDAPYRFLASVLGLAWVAAALAGTTPLTALHHASAWLSWTWLSETTDALDLWASSRLGAPLFSTVSLILVATLVYFTYTDHRDALAEDRTTATLWFVVAIASYSAPAPWIITALIVGLLIRGIVERTRTIVVSGFWETIGWTALQALGGLIWTPLLLVLWVSGAAESKQASK